MGERVAQNQAASQQTSCWGKLRYLSEPTARAASGRSEAAHSKRLGRRARIVVNFYRCSFCGAWHLTHVR